MATSVSFRKRLLEVVRRRPRSLNLEYSMWTLKRLADFMAEDMGNHLSTETIHRELAREDIVFSCPPHTISSPDPEYQVKKKTVEETRDHRKVGDVFYDADEFNVSWLPDSGQVEVIRSIV